MSPALAGGFFKTEPPGTPLPEHLKWHLGSHYISVGELGDIGHRACLCLNLRHCITAESSHVHSFAILTLEGWKEGETDIDR